MFIDPEPLSPFHSLNNITIAAFVDPWHRALQLDIQVCLNTLRLMRHLRYLDLSGNPVAEETGYRLLMIKSLPWLETLDMHKVSTVVRICKYGRENTLGT